ncbi:MAG TPA: type III-B CRISPR module-associated protein Cmr3 [Thermoanaerobaculia bacterium]|nr:type III-B CRISPR module-associated protein Cmr3 [Thermoanaerobaculia bacterium]
MSVWLIEPLDPLIARDGLPAAAVGKFSTVGFPYPSTTAGAARTRMGSEGGAFVVQREALGELKNVEVRGPLLAELAENGDVLQWLAPAPRDAVFLRPEGEDRPNLHRLIPRPLEEGEATDALPEGGLLPLFVLGEAPTGKPPGGIPSFWRWEELEGWLLAPKDRTGVDFGALGIRKLPVETRTHLALQPGERVGIDGMFFQTAGLRFLYPTQTGENEERYDLSPRRLALSVWSPGGRVAGRDLALAEQIAPLGGERRLARWSKASRGWPELPEEVRESIARTARARLILLTPAVFATGALPGWNEGLAPWSGARIRITVRAASVPRPEIVSGWDLEKGRPKKTKRLAAAGSVYFLELDGGGQDDLLRWCEETWLACVSDDAQDRRDGFGLAVLGTWEES